ncbi:MAG: hypothetical protein AAF763_04605 [Pseudomonadota bacterium]
MSDQQATAALSLLESLMLTLEERGIIDPSDVEEVYDVAISAHLDAGGGRDDEIARLLHRLKVRGSPARYES